MKVIFSPKAWGHYLHWIETDQAILKKLNTLIEEARRTPFTGLGKPEPLRDDFRGFWSRRITGEHRLVYRVEGRKGEEQHLEIASCRFHYQRN